MFNLYELFVNFYTTKRLSDLMSDDGGPFGFDIHFALEVDYLIKKYNCKVFFETGTNKGDTAEYVCKTYPDIQVISCETKKEYFDFSKDRLKNFRNFHIFNKSSEEVVKQIFFPDQTIFYYLDAHWNDYWPLADELKNIQRGVVCVSDFHNEFQYNRNSGFFYSYDTYNDINCDFKFLSKHIDRCKVYTNNVLNENAYEFPCQQMTRRTGRAYFTKKIEEDYFQHSKYFLPIN